MDKDILGLSTKRLNRSSYFLSILVSMFFFVGLGLAIDALLRLIGFKPFGAEEPGIFTVLAMIAWYVYAPYCIVRRFHDLSMSGWWILTAFVPLLNLFIGIKLLFFKGNPKTNKYGEPLGKTYIMGLGL